MMIKPADVDWRGLSDVALAGAVLDGIPQAIAEAERRLADATP